MTIKLSISNFPWYPAVCRVNDVLSAAGFELRIVGGAVRDIILMKSPKDIDLCTTATPSEMVTVFTESNFTFHDTGIQHGTLTVYKKRTAFEITSLRNDHIDNQGNKEVVYCTSFEQDASRRDLTINALSMTLAGEVFDYYDGVKDILSQKVKFVESARLRLTEDPLRILRYFRMHCTLDWPLHNVAGAHTVIEELAPLLKGVSGERVWKELQRILISRQAVKVLDMFLKCKIMDYIGIPCELVHTPLQDYLTCDEIRHFKVKKSEKSAVILGLIVNCPKSLTTMFKSWKASNRCIEVALFANEHKDQAMTMKYIRGYLYNFQIDVKLDKEKEMLVTFLCTRQHDAVSAELINDVWMFKRPEFDFTTDDFVRVPAFKSKRKDALKVLKQAWVESDFTMTKNELVTRLLQLTQE